MESRLVDLEVKFAYQEDLIEQLNQVIIEQQKTVDDLSVKLDRLTKLVASFDGSGIKDIKDEEPPPHY